MKLTPLHQLVAGLALIIIFFGMGEIVFLKGKKESIVSTQTQITKLKADVEKARKIQANAASLKEELDQLSKQLDALKNVLPVKIEHQKFFKDIRRLANEEGIEVLRQSRNNIVQEEEVIYHPYTVISRGGYHDYGRFFAKLSRYPILVNVRGLQISRSDNDDFALSSGFVISLFTYKEPTEEELAQQLEERKKAKKANKKKTGKGH